ncbi:hypothetical protein PPTG_20894 [Phytophthora nicotianae INRA-310]|uniref:Uncharacterized protein n=1 Tax=Phytophthora nicotianae (strain INRA-310) TaxID=761204 RepID=W2RAA7_PHYN3|nr:hypothetical protein PPTG_20894 [Phytophthora nicotianae INRA-310]ETN22181.1 hypothetical protein PPTG_20894 [Phytophthora nicotianae INRA-310]
MPTINIEGMEVARNLTLLDQQHTRDDRLKTAVSQRDTAGEALEV